jgi:hypothetical protein
MNRLLPEELAGRTAGYRLEVVAEMRLIGIPGHMSHMGQ